MESKQKESADSKNIREWMESVGSVLEGFQLQGDSTKELKLSDLADSIQILESLVSEAKELEALLVAEYQESE